MTAKITAKDIQNLPDGWHYIAPNLYVRVRGSGSSRAFFFRYQFAGKRRDLSLGVVGSISMTDVKKEADKCRAMLAKGIDPKEVRDEGRAEKQRKSVTFGEFWAGAIDRIAEVRKLSPTTVRGWVTSIKLHAVPYLRNIPVSEIKTEDVLKVLSPIWDEKPVMASNCRSRLEAIFNLAKREGIIPFDAINPATWDGHLDTVLSRQKPLQRGHNKAFSVEDLREQLLASLAARKPVHQSFVFGVLTASRQAEFTEARWDEIDFESAVWTVPPERRKDRHSDPFRVPLSTQVIELLKSIARNPDQPYVFSSRYKNDGHVARYYVSTMVFFASGKSATMHGCRSTFRDWAAREDVNWTVAEMCLMHKPGNATAMSYFRDDLLEKRRDVMQRWADEILPLDVMHKVLG